MGFLDKLKMNANKVKEKAVDAVDDHAPQIKSGVEKAGAFVDKKTKGKYSDKIAKGTKAVESAVDKMDKDSDQPNAEETGDATTGGTAQSDHPNPASGHTSPPPASDPTP